MFRGRGGSNGRGRGQGARGRGRGGSFGIAHDTTKLPVALRKELGIEEPAASPHFAGRGRGRGRGQSRGHPTTVIGRKQARKDERSPGNKPSMSSNSQSHKRARDDASASVAQPVTAPPPAAKKPKIAPAMPESKLSRKAEGKKRAKEPRDDKLELGSKTTQRKHVDAKTQTPLERLLAAQSSGSSVSASASNSRRHIEDEIPNRKKRSRMTQAEKDEEDEIAWLEAHLGAGKASGEGGDEDGLDGLIQDLDRYQTGMFDADPPGSDDEDEDSSDAEMEEVELEDEDSGESEMEEDLDAYESEDADDQDEGQEDEEGSSDDDGTAGSQELDSAPAKSNPTAASAAPNPAPSSSGKYIPPALRKLAAAGQEVTSKTLDIKPTTSAAVVDPKLQRTLNGLLNRLSSANLDSILGEILATYTSYPRAIVTQTLVRLVLETVALQPNLVDSIVIMYAALFASLGRSVGVEFGAEATQVLVGRLVHAHSQIRSRQRRAAGSGTGAGSSTSDEDQAGRECMNLAVLLGHTYNLHLVATPLIYDVVRLCLREPAAVRAGRDLQAVHLQSAANQASVALSKDAQDTVDQDDSAEMCEIDVEVLLKLVKACGSQMRSDDPSALRDIVDLTQERVAPSSSTSAKLGSRARFMLEALTELQKSRPKSKGHALGGGADGTVAVEALTRYKRYIAGMVKRPERLLRSSAGAGVSATDEPLLRIRLRDLADSTKKGRWWLVGAAWTGHDDDDEDAGEGVTAKRKLAKEGRSQDDGGGGDGGGAAGSSGPVSSSSSSAQAAEAGLLALAREHGMNTDARRSVFVTLMSSEDFVDASQRLLGLGLNEVQRREVVRVLLHCLGSEPIYNPYYVLVGQQLASESGALAGGGSSLALSTTSNVISTRVTLQYCLWDYFRDIGEKEVGGVSMIASGQNQDGHEDEFVGFGDGDEAFGGAGGDAAGDEGGMTGVNRKMIHLARAYGWWIAKGALNLNMLRTVNLAGLKKRGRAFVQLLLCHVLLSIQAKSPTKTLNIKFQPEKTDLRHRSAVEQILVRGTAGNLELARGLLIFVKRHLRSGDLGHILGGAVGTKDSGSRQALEWAVGVTVEVLEVGIQVAGQV